MKIAAENCFADWGAKKNIMRFVPVDCAMKNTFFTSILQLHDSVTGSCGCFCFFMRCKHLS